MVMRVITYLGCIRAVHTYNVCTYIWVHNHWRVLDRVRVGWSNQGYAPSPGTRDRSWTTTEGKGLGMRSISQENLTGLAFMCVLCRTVPYRT